MDPFFPPADGVSEDSSQGENHDGAKGRPRHVDRQEVGALILRRPKSPQNDKQFLSIACVVQGPLGKTFLIWYFTRSIGLTIKGRWKLFTDKQTH